MSSQRTIPVSFKLSEIERKMLDSIVRELDSSRSDALRYALSAARNQLGLRTRDAEAFIDRLREGMKDNATISVQLDDTWTPFVTVDGARREDVYVPTLVVNLGAAGDFLQVYLGDEKSDVRIFLGLLPMRSGVPLVISAKDLTPGMQPRPVAYFVD